MDLWKFVAIWILDWYLVYLQLGVIGESRRMHALLFPGFVNSGSCSTGVPSKF